LNQATYDDLNHRAALAPIGSQNLKIFPFGNGAERMLEDRLVGAVIADVDLNIHDISHLSRAAQEGVACAFRYGLDIMKEYTGISAEVIRAGEANMFLSPVFTEAMANLLGAGIELYQTDGAIGAARGAGIGAGIYRNADDAINNLRLIRRIEPDESKRQLYESYYSDWLDHLHKILN
jgi:xylulokinase